MLLEWGEHLNAFHDLRTIAWKLELGLDRTFRHSRGCSGPSDGVVHPDKQLNIMNARVIALVAQEQPRWQLAGDQLFIDLDLSADNVPPGTQLSLGSAVIEVTGEPLTGCKKFVDRFGSGALKLINSPAGKHLQLRGINAKVVQPGVIRVGEAAKKI
jgi:MOSC domain-containing protein YiiM